jgi:hypothetical protein
MDGQATAPRHDTQDLARKIVDGLNEVRMLMLGGQILLGFQYHAAFTPLFERLPAFGRALDLVALLGMVAAFIALASVAPFHRLLEGGAATERLHRFLTLMVECALWPFAACFGIDVLLVTLHHLPLWLGAALALGIAALALALWRAPAALRRRHIDGDREGGRMAKAWRTPGKTVEISLKDRIGQLLTEARLILPGAQAMLGFQFTAVLTETFDKLPEAARLAHIGGLVAIAAAVIMLMSPACYHRIVAAGDARPDVERYSTRVILGALVPLGLGLAADLYVVASVVLGSDTAAIGLAAAAVVGAAALWFGLPAALAARIRQTEIV